MPAMSPSAMSPSAVMLSAGHWWAVKDSPKEVLESIKGEYIALQSDHPGVKSVIASLEALLAKGIDKRSAIT